MAITALTPAANNVVDPGDSLAFTIDDTYTTITIEVETSSGWEYAYDSSLGGAQSGYTVEVVDNGDGTHTFTFERTAGFNLNPFSVRVIEDETGTSATTTTNYYLSSEVSFPQGSDPYYGTYEGNTRVTNDGVLVAANVKWINFVGFTVTDNGNGKVTVEIP